MSAPPVSTAEEASRQLIDFPTSLEVGETAVNWIAGELFKCFAELSVLSSLAPAEIREQGVNYLFDSTISKFVKAGTAEDGVKARTDILRVVFPSFATGGAAWCSGIFWVSAALLRTWMVMYRSNFLMLGYKQLADDLLKEMVRTVAQLNRDAIAKTTATPPAPAQAIEDGCGRRVAEVPELIEDDVAHPTTKVRGGNYARGKQNA